MKKLTLSFLTTTALLAGAASASAADYGRPLPPPPAPIPYAAPAQQGYVSVFGGYGWSQFGQVKGSGLDHDIANNNNNNWLEEWTTNGKIGGGWLLGVAIGTNISHNVRGELEASFIRMKTNTSSTFSCNNLNGNNSCDNVNFNGNVANDWTGTRSGAGRLDNVFLMANLWYDFAPGSVWNPYVGGGVGLVHSKGSFKSAFISHDANNKNYPGDFLDHNVDAWGLAFQAGFGMRFAMTQNIALDVGYRFKAGMNLATTAVSNLEVENYPDDVSRWSGSDRLNFGIHTVQVGLTMGF